MIFKPNILKSSHFKTTGLKGAPQLLHVRLHHSHRKYASDRCSLFLSLKIKAIKLLLTLSFYFFTPLKRNWSTSTIIRAASAAFKMTSRVSPKNCVSVCSTPLFYDDIHCIHSDQNHCFAQPHLHSLHGAIHLFILDLFCNYLYDNIMFHVSDLLINLFIH